jgi:hypothetical protein
LHPLKAYYSQYNKTRHVFLAVYEVGNLVIIPSSVNSIKAKRRMELGSPQTRQSTTFGPKRQKTIIIIIHHYKIENHTSEQNKLIITCPQLRKRAASCSSVTYMKNKENQSPKINNAKQKYNVHRDIV